MNYYPRVPKLLKPGLYGMPLAGAASMGYSRLKNLYNAYKQGSSPAVGSAVNTGLATSRLLYKKKKKRGRKAKRRYRAARRFNRRVRNVLVGQVYPKSSYFVVTAGDIKSPNISKQNSSTILASYSTTDLQSMLTSARSKLYAYNNTDRLICTGTYNEIRLTNQENVNVTVDLYVLYPRRDITTAEYSSGISGFWDVGLQDAGYAASSYQQPGMTPYLSQRLTELFKIASKRRITMQPGAMSTVIYKNRRKFEISNEVFGTARSMSLLKGRTMCVLAVVCGQPTNDSTNKDNVGIASSKVDWTCHQTYYYEVPVAQFSNGSSSVTFGTITTAEDVNPASGSVVNEAQA